MGSEFWLNQIPLWAIFLFTVIACMLSIWIGKISGNWHRLTHQHETNTSLTTIISATLGLLAFLLTFTFAMSGQSFESRRQLLLDEVNDISTAYLRAELLPNPQQKEIKALLRKYVDIRVDLANENTPQKMQKFSKYISEFDKLEDAMWELIVPLAKADNRSLNNVLFIDSLNKMMDRKNSQLVLLSYNVPSIIWNVLILITILGMFMIGYQSGLSDKSSLWISFLLALIFATVILLIADLDRPLIGNLKVNQKPLFNLQIRMHT
jgi:hypothetical protein